MAVFSWFSQNFAPTSPIDFNGIEWAATTQTNENSYQSSDLPSPEGGITVPLETNEPI
jgi:hypothetical protein